MKQIGLLLLALTLVVGAHAAEKSVNIDSLKREIINNSKELQEQRKDSLMLSKLSPDQLLELKQQELEVRKKEIEKDSRQEMPFSSFQLLLIMVLPFVFVTLIIYLTSMSKKEEAKRRYDLYTKSLEMGQSVPDHFFDEPKKTNPVSDLKKGILWLVVGIAILISFVVMDHKNGLIIGIVPTFVGIGYLLVHYLEKPKTNTTGNSDEQR
ncbi:hypothetical protein Palpr_2142 [Paludibacter propionicigenes WB4]|uniref:DUF6249 domain-containing protein n=1 Tax=Paludibacter propionicigenes (strain DSM 17365 / JCM 13257 / WB4) TaxID=694427 RepID=E4T6D4_PALPW|nr:DUF6249 domain-containing protein [Paludibacter propionicigenes]ADQ80278.1 hypothetical protein Palpr_2142 [Paludibacter propionicigenes WB4]